MTQLTKKELRKLKIRARDSLSATERDVFSGQIVEKILDFEEFQKAHTIMLYRATKGEVSLRELEKAAQKSGKRLAYPLCISKSEMIALRPMDATAWKSGYRGIEEPILEKSDVIEPEEIDLIICPCTVFDEQGGRMGMGAGFYDRYLEKCTNACVTAVAFEVQKAAQVPMEAWDKRMNIIFTEKEVYK